jgi:5-formyltetrahydrofolate cyclo-ligase
LLRDAAMGEAYARDKELIRRPIEAERRALPRSEVARLSAAACERVLRLSAFQHAARVAVYAARDNELDPVVIVQASRAAGKVMYYPDVRRDGPGFVESSGRPAAPAESILFLVPGVAFDVRGVRLGRGRGWYDRALARYAGGIRLGLAYEFQVVPALPEAPWDVRMHAVVTESRMIGDLPATA